MMTKTDFMVKANENVYVLPELLLIFFVRIKIKVYNK